MLSIILAAATGFDLFADGALSEQIDRATALPAYLRASGLDALADRCSDGLEPVGAQKVGEFAENPPDERGAGVEERGVKLDKRGAGENLPVGVAGGENAADADQRRGAFERL